MQLIVIKTLPKPGATFTGLPGFFFSSLFKQRPRQLGHGGHAVVLR